jgi:hypothetical protein
MKSGFYQALGALESFPVLDTVTKEVVGINIPKIVVTRSDTERLDVAVSEIGNTVAFGVGGVLADQVFRKAFESAQSAGASAFQKQCATVGRSFGIYSVIFSLMWAMPFVRNYITARKTGSVKFTDVIESGYSKKSGDQHEHKSVLQDALADYRGRVLTILGLGMGGAIASVGLGRLAASSQQQIGKSFLNKFCTSRMGENLLLKGGQFAKFGGWPALLFWGVPAYGGWLHASRDPYEKKEQVLKFANFVACFFGPPVLMNRWFQNKCQQAFPRTKLKEWSYEAINNAFSANSAAQQKALGLWAKKNLVGLGSSILLLGTMPQLMNIYLTKRRIQRDLQARQVQSTHKPNLFRQNPPGSMNGQAFYHVQGQRPIPVISEGFGYMQPVYARQNYINPYRQKASVQVAPYLPATQFYRPVVF